MNNPNLAAGETHQTKKSAGKFDSFLFFPSPRKKVISLKHVPFSLSSTISLSLDCQYVKGVWQDVCVKGLWGFKLANHCLCLSTSSFSANFSRNKLSINFVCLGFFAIPILATLPTLLHIYTTTITKISPLSFPSPCLTPAAFLLLHVSFLDFSVFFFIRFLDLNAARCR